MHSIMNTSSLTPPLLGTALTCLVWLGSPILWKISERTELEPGGRLVRDLLSYRGERKHRMKV